MQPKWCLFSVIICVGIHDITRGSEGALNETPKNVLDFNEFKFHLDSRHFISNALNGVSVFGSVALLAEKWCMMSVSFGCKARTDAVLLSVGGFLECGSKPFKTKVAAPTCLPEAPREHLSRTSAENGQKVRVTYSSGSRVSVVGVHFSRVSMHTK